MGTWKSWIACTVWPFWLPDPFGWGVLDSTIIFGEVQATVESCMHVKQIHQCFRHRTVLPLPLTGRIVMTKHLKIQIACSDPIQFPTYEWNLWANYGTVESAGKTNQPHVPLIVLLYFAPLPPLLNSGKQTFLQSPSFKGYAGSYNHMGV